jgi:MoxR-like ATPase
MPEKIAVNLTCPECGKTYKMGHVSPGKRVRCRCGCQFETASARDGTNSLRSDQHPEISNEEALNAVERLAKVKAAILKEVGKVIVGQTDVLEQIITGFFAGGHCLLMGVPGLAKTLMVQSLAQTMQLDFKRIQFTPDLMPTDITGTNILEDDPETGQRHFTFHKGPVFTNILLADEINRTPPKTQAALLEAMQEHHVTTAGKTHQLPIPFLVLATQNPLELEGTYPLPEAQLDRFMLLIKVNYPNLEEEQRILMSTTSYDGQMITGLLDAKSVTRFQSLVRRVPVSEHVANYAARLCRATRPQGDVPDFIRSYVRYGCGPRAGQSLLLCAKAHVVLNGRFNVSCADVRDYALPVMRHRVILNFAAASEGLDSDDIIRRLLDTVDESESR